MSDVPDRPDTPASSPPPAGHTPRRSSRASVGPIVLIGLGVLLLAANTGAFAVGDLFRLLTFWPVALVAVGVDMLTNGRYRALVVVAALAVVLLLWGGNVGRSGSGWWTIGSTAPAGRSVAVEHALEGATAGRVTLDLGVGRVRVDGDARGGTLVSGTIVTGRGESLRESVGRDGGTKVVELRSEQERLSGIGMSGDDRRWDLSLTREVPVALRVNAGVGQTTLDLGQVTLTSLTFRGGVGESTITLPAGSYAGTVDVGVGSMTVRVPRDAAVQLVVNAGLGRVNVANDLRRDGDTYTSPGFESARERITLRVNGGVGSIAIERR
jgi:hypothetical protein